MLALCRIPLLGFLWLQSEPVDDRLGGRRRAADIGVDFEIDRRLLGRIFQAELLELSQRACVGDLMEFTSRWIAYPTFLFCLAYCQANEADSTTVAFNKSNDASRKASWDSRFGTEREDDGPSLTGCFFDDGKPESLPEFDERS